MAEQKLFQKEGKGEGKEVEGWHEMNTIDRVEDGTPITRKKYMCKDGRVWTALMVILWRHIKGSGAFLLLVILWCHRIAVGYFVVLIFT